MVTAVILACHRRKCGVEGEELQKGSDASEQAQRHECEGRTMRVNRQNATIVITF
jgi:hypothetical protein